MYAFRKNNAWWIGILLAVICTVTYKSVTQKNIPDISQVDTSHFGILWNKFDGKVRPLLYLAKITLLSLNYAIIKSEYDLDEDTGLVWASYRHEPKKEYPPIVKIRIQKRPTGGLVLFYQADKDYLSLRNPAALPGPFSKKIYDLIRTEEYEVKEVFQDQY